MLRNNTRYLILTCRYYLNHNVYFKYTPLLTLYIIITSSSCLLIKGWKCKNAACGIDWVGAPVQFQRSVCFIIAAANRKFRLTAGKFVPVCNSTLMNVRKFTIPSNNSGYRESTDLSNYTSLYSLCHADSATSDFPLHNRIEGRL